MKILATLADNSDEHLTAEEIYRLLLDSGEEIGLATVYRVLTQFESAGLVKRHHFEGGQSVFELDEGKHHDHLVCVKCGKVVEFCDDVIESHQKAIAEKAGFVLADHSLILYGICSDPGCRGKSEG